ncbi:MAG: hypothetical protein LBT40_07855 [Deltaproteobacteria bacterium]|nr:hypothetical protein [Deltaproteobacteria bacterium]
MRTLLIRFQTDQELVSSLFKKPETQYVLEAVDYANNLKVGTGSLVDRAGQNHSREDKNSLYNLLKDANGFRIVRFKAEGNARIKKKAEDAAHAKAKNESSADAKCKADAASRSWKEAQSLVRDNNKDESEAYARVRAEITACAKA